MRVFKFGGTSVGSPESMHSVMKLIADGEKKLIVLSAMSGTTNCLVEISNYLYNGNKKSALEAINSLEKRYYNIIPEIFKREKNIEQGKLLLRENFETIKSHVDGTFSEKAEKEVLAQGEIISTKIFTLLLQENGHNAVLLPALDFMKKDEESVVDYAYIREKITNMLKKHPEAFYYITQGFICRNHKGDIDNLQRGGSDYTATLVGQSINSKEVQIWTDIDGFHNNDPRYVKNTKRVDQLSFDEAAELAYFGAKILHPQTILPAKVNNIPVRLKNTKNPTDQGTLITSRTSGTGLKAVAAKDNITAIKIRSGRMLNAYGFMKSIFAIFELFKTPIDMITTSEVAVSVTIDNPKNLDEIVESIKKYGEVEVDKNQSIICIVGDMIAGEDGYAAKIFTSIEGIPVRMISYGGSKNNISILVNTKDKQRALQELNDNLLNPFF